VVQSKKRFVSGHRFSDADKVVDRAALAAGALAAGASRVPAAKAGFKSRAGSACLKACPDTNLFPCTVTNPPRDDARRDFSPLVRLS
jgi:hypothetical protein